jgi:hypothetical protein
LVFPPNVDRDQIKFTVSFGINPVTTPIKVVAESEAAGAPAEYPLTLEVGAMPKLNPMPKQKKKG